MIKRLILVQIELVGTFYLEMSLAKSIPAKPILRKTARVIPNVFIIIVASDISTYKMNALPHPRMDRQPSRYN